MRDKEDQDNQRTRVIKNPGLAQDNIRYVQTICVHVQLRTKGGTEKELFRFRLWSCIRSLRFPAANAIRPGFAMHADRVFRRGGAGYVQGAVGRSQPEEHKDLEGSGSHLGE